jgi:hypothetical protein
VTWYDTPIRETTCYNKKQKTSVEKAQWARFTYVGRETRAITKAFKKTTIKVTYSTNSTLRKLLTKNHNTHRNKYEKSGVYQITCPTCNTKYTGQIGRSFNTRFQEHFRDFKHGNGKSKFAQHVLGNGHAFGPIEEIMDTVHFTNKGRLMNAIEGFYIF